MDDNNSRMIISNEKALSSFFLLNVSAKSLTNEHGVIRGKDTLNRVIIVLKNPSFEDFQNGVQ